jgi:hypothetical protein
VHDFGATERRGDRGAIGLAPAAQAQASGRELDVTLTLVTPA